MGSHRINHLRIICSWDVMNAYADLKVNEDNTNSVINGNLDHTACRIMKGNAYVRDKKMAR